MKRYQKSKRYQSRRKKSNRRKSHRRKSHRRKSHRRKSHRKQSKMRQSHRKQYKMRQSHRRQFNKKRSRRKKTNKRKGKMEVVQVDSPDIVGEISEIYIERANDFLAEQKYHDAYANFKLAEGINPINPDVIKGIEITRIGLIHQLTQADTNFLSEIQIQKKSRNKSPSLLDEPIRGVPGLSEPPPSPPPKKKLDESALEALHISLLTNLLKQWPTSFDISLYDLIQRETMIEDPSAAKNLIFMISDFIVSNIKSMNSPWKQQGYTDNDAKKYFNTVKMKDPFLGGNMSTHSIKKEYEYKIFNKTNILPSIKMKKSSTAKSNPAPPPPPVVATKTGGGGAAKSSSQSDSK